MKFLHFNDIRIGSSSESGTPWERDRRIELEDGLARILREAERCGADLVLIAGGLYSHIPVTEELDMLKAQFSRFPDRQFVLIAGETEPVRRSSPVLSYTWPENVHYVTGGQVERILLENLHTEIFAASVTENGTASVQEFADAAAAAESTVPVRIAMLRSDGPGCDREIADKLSRTGLSYIAVGSSEPGSRTISSIAHCPGFFEPETMQDSGKHGVLEGGISETTGVLEKIEFRPMAAASYIPLLIRVSPDTTTEEIRELVTREIERRGASNIYRLKLTGVREPDADLSIGELKQRYRISEVIDETEPGYDYRALFAEHPQDMIGFYISRIVSDKKEMSAVERRAMYYGLNALLHSNEKQEVQK